jgi:hypothetical protein
MLPEIYEKHLVTQLTKTQYLIVSVLVQLLSIYRWVRLEELANKFPSPILWESRRRKLQRFLESPNLTIENIWLPIITGYIRTFFSTEESLYIVIDRTKWKKNNLMMIALRVAGRAIPLYWELLDHQGSSDVETQKILLNRVLPLFADYTKVVLGDREFCGVELARWLEQQKNTYFCLRLKKDEYVEREKDIWLTLKDLELEPGMSLYLQGVKITKTKGFGPINLVGKWKRKYRGWTAEEGWFILTNLDSLSAALLAYQKRFGIEEMFRDFKSGGYNLEDTLLTGHRLSTLILLITLAYASATFSGEILKGQGNAKYVGRVKEKGRTERRHSDFYLGIHALSWVESLQKFDVEIRALMNLSPGKRANYQRGMRAASLILSAL